MSKNYHKVGSCVNLYWLFQLTFMVKIKISNKDKNEEVLNNFLSRTKYEYSRTGHKWASKCGPRNYFGEPKFIHPLTFNSKKILDEHIKIEYEENKKGPIRNYKNLIKRIKGI